MPGLPARVRRRRFARRRAAGVRTAAAAWRRRSRTPRAKHRAVSRATAMLLETQKEEGPSSRCIPSIQDACSFSQFPSPAIKGERPCWKSSQPSSRAMEPKKGVDIDTHVFVFQLATFKICTIFLTIDGWPSSTFARKTTATLVLKSRCGDAYVFLSSVRLFVVLLWKQKNKKTLFKRFLFLSSSEVTHF